jgi:hypothetical protein
MNRATQTYNSFAKASHWLANPIVEKGEKKRWQDGCVAIAPVDSLRQYSYRVIKPEPLFFKRDDIRTTLFRVSLQHQRMMLQAHDAFQRPMFHEVLRLAIACRRSLRRSSLNKPRRPSSRVFIYFFYPCRFNYKLDPVMPSRASLD